MAVRCCPCRAHLDRVSPIPYLMGSALRPTWQVTHGPQQIMPRQSIMPLLLRSYFLRKSARF